MPDGLFFSMMSSSLLVSVSVQWDPPFFLALVVGVGFLAAAVDAGVLDARSGGIFPVLVAAILA